MKPWSLFMLACASTAVFGQIPAAYTHYWYSGRSVNDSASYRKYPPGGLGGHSASECSFYVIKSINPPLGLYTKGDVYERKVTTNGGQWVKLPPAHNGSTLYYPVNHPVSRANNRPLFLGSDAMSVKFEYAHYDATQSQWDFYPAVSMGSWPNPMFIGPFGGRGSAYYSMDGRNVVSTSQSPVSPSWSSAYPIFDLATTDQGKLNFLDSSDLYTFDGSTVASALWILQPNVAFMPATIGSKSHLDETWIVDDGGFVHKLNPQGMVSTIGAPSSPLFPAVATSTPGGWDDSKGAHVVVAGAKVLTGPTPYAQTQDIWRRTWKWSSNSWTPWHRHPLPGGRRVVGSPTYSREARCLAVMDHKGDYWVGSISSTGQWKWVNQGTP